MTGDDLRAPVLVGLGEVVRRPGEPGPTEPCALAAEAIDAALTDAGASRELLRDAALGSAPPVAWPDGDPGRRVADLLGRPMRTLRSSMQGGNGPQLLVNALAARIQAGELETAVVAGGEALGSAARAMRDGRDLGWPAPDAGRCASEVLEAERAAATEGELAVGMLAPIIAYPLIENALRIAAGRSPAEHQALIARIWSRFSEIAATQPAAWTQRPYTAEELAVASPGNRQVTLPYTKLLNANIQVDQGAAVILCSVARARTAGIDEDRWVYVHAGAHATDEWFLSERPALHRSPAIRACGEAAFAHAGIEPGQLGPVDLYSCFPAAVQLAAGELDLPLDDPARPLTATGGLTFFGGPGNNYATHGIVAVARALREAPPGTTGLATAMGWYATKHAVGVYGNRPPARPFAALAPEPARPRPREVAEPAALTGTAETGTVVYDREGAPSYGIVFALLDDGRRALGKTDDREVLDAMGAGQVLGDRVALRRDRSFHPC